MSNIKELITYSLEYYDRHLEMNLKLMSKFKYFSIEPSYSDVEHNKIIFYDIHKNEIYKSRFEVIGLYDISTNIWSWAWAIPTLSKNKINISRKILNYGLEIPPGPELDESSIIKTELITSRFKIDDPIQIDIHIGIASYISKKTFVYRVIYDLKLSEMKQEELKEVRSDMKPGDVIWYIFLLDEHR